MSERGRSFKEAVTSWSPLKKSLFILAIGTIVYGTTIILDGSLISQLMGTLNLYPDVELYRARTSTILEGGLLYTDVHTETPPLINYLLVPAQLLGGAEHVWIYSAYFSLFGILSGLLMYLALRRYGELPAFVMGLLFVLSPFGFLEGGLANDETIVAFTVIVPALLMVLERNRAASLAIGLGIWTKMWAVLLAPAHFLQMRSWRERILVIAIIAGISIAVATPFLILAGDEFTWFLQYYFIGNSERKNEGLSAQMFLDMGGFEVPNMLSLVIVVIGMLFAYFYAYKKGMGKWESMTLAVVVFFALYPKMHGGYYLIPVAFLLAWGAGNWKIAARCFLLYIPVILAVAFAPPVTIDGQAFFHFEGSWVLGLICALTATIMLLETAYTAMKERSFITQAIEARDTAGKAAGPSISVATGLDGEGA